MINKTARDIFKKGSKTYFYSSFFFPNKIKEDVFILYSFVRKADDLVDSKPQRPKEFTAFRDEFTRAYSSGHSSDAIIDSFVALMSRKDIRRGWVEAFLHSMELDLSKFRYLTLEETKEYMYGSAEVIGLMMAKVLDLPEASYDCARLLGRAMQYINFIRDINEDLSLGRTYLPYDEMQRSRLYSLTREEAEKKKQDFTFFIASSVSLYMHWQAEAEKGFKFIPKRYLVPIKIASDLYKWTARKIRRDPLIVYKKKVRPSIVHIFLCALKNAIIIYLYKIK